MCRRCGKELEAIQHISAACEQLTPTEYIKRHDEVAKLIHQKLAEAAELTDDKCPYYTYKPANVWRMTTSNCTRIAALLWTKQYLSTDLT
jgi:hypothetical protein